MYLWEVEFVDLLISPIRISAVQQWFELNTVILSTDAWNNVDLIYQLSFRLADGTVPAYIVLHPCCIMYYTLNEIFNHEGKSRNAFALLPGLSAVFDIEN